MEVKLINLTKEFDKQGNKKKETDKVVAVDHINIDIPDGKLIGLLGPSGCGKSTTLYMIAGLHRPTDGQIFFGEREVTELPPEKRGIGLVFQNYALYPHLSVAENIMFPLISRNENKKEAYEKALKMAELVGIEMLMERKPSQLSGGQQQRVAIARALVKMPEVLLLDEPLSNLDARLRLQTREEIKRIQRTTGITTIFVTHDQEEAMSISDEIVVMNFGVIQQIGKPQDVYNEPVNEFVAKFLGTPPINIIEGYYTEKGFELGEQLFLDETGIDEAKNKELIDDYNYEKNVVVVEKYEELKRVLIDNIRSEYEKYAKKAMKKKQEVLPIEEYARERLDSIEMPKPESNLHLGIRPESFEITTDGKYEMFVEFVEYIGRDKIVIFKLAGVNNKTFKAVIPAEVNIEVGQSARFNLKKYFIFDKAGRRII